MLMTGFFFVGIPILISLVHSTETIPSFGQNKFAVVDESRAVCVRVLFVVPSAEEIAGKTKVVKKLVRQPKEEKKTPNKYAAERN